MNINFKMWRTAAWQLVKMEDKKKWDALDVVSKWLIATRSGVTTVTIYSCIIAGLLAWQDKSFAWLPWIIVTIGLFIAHGTNNLLNDYTDFSRGIDKDNYFRIQYGVHPLVQGFWTKAAAIALVRGQRRAGNPFGSLRPFLHPLQPAGDRPVRFRRVDAAVLYLSAQVFRAGRTGHLPDLGTDHGGRRVPGPDRALELERGPGSRPVWVMRGEHQRGQAHRQAPGGQGQRSHHSASINRRNGGTTAEY